MGFSPTPASGFGIADAPLGGTADCKWAYYDTDGRFIGAIFDGGFAQHGVSGGVGAFYGIRGQMGAPPAEPLPDAPPLRTASISEDPGSRRMRGGGKLRVVFHLIPAERPEIHAIYHENLAPVTAANPASPGQVLILQASGLGPLSPGAKPSSTDPFPNPPVEVNSPLEVAFDGQSVPVINKVGWPGQTSVYRVDVRVPGGTAGPTADIRVTAAWIPGGAYRVPIGRP